MPVRPFWRSLCSVSGSGPLRRQGGKAFASFSALGPPGVGLRPTRHAFVENIARSLRQTNDHRRIVAGGEAIFIHHDFVRVNVALGGGWAQTSSGRIDQPDHLSVCRRASRWILDTPRAVAECMEQQAVGTIPVSRWASPDGDACGDRIRREIFDYRRESGTHGPSLQ